MALLPRNSLALILAMPLAACAATNLPLPGGPQPRASEPYIARPSRGSAGLGGVIGASANVLTARFGEPRIDLVEGDARKLQFSGESCVLDIYLYPQRRGGTRIATEAVARLREGGADTDPAACAREVEARRRR
jgi:hypothetical protein